MLAITQQHKTQVCTPNILPCKIHHSGQVNASSRHWDPQSSTDGKETAYFRGRKLHGRTMKIPQGYRGVVVEKSDRVLTQTEEKKLPYNEEEEYDDDEEEAPPEVKLLEQVASFDRFTVWDHEAVPTDSDDTYIKSMQEWLVLAEAMNSWDQEASI